MRACMCVVCYVWWCCIVLYYSIFHIATIMVQCCSVLFHIAALSSCSWLGARAGDPHCGAANRNMLQSFRTLSPFFNTPSPLPPIPSFLPPSSYILLPKIAKKMFFSQGKYEVHSIVHVRYCWKKVDRFIYFNNIFSFEMKLRNVL